MGARTSYAAFPSLAEPPLIVAGKLVIPQGAPPGRTPAVLICHGSDGVDGRGAFHAGALQAVGVATFEIDMWAARGTGRGAAARPRSPLETLPDAFGALRFLATQPEIDPARIAIMGFSWGGAVTLLSASRRFAAGLRGEAIGFAAHAAFYPVCWSFMRPGGALSPLTGAPVLIQNGDADGYDDPDAGDKLMAFLPPEDVRHVRQITHRGAGHGFDRNRQAKTITDPFAHNGKGGEVLMAFHPGAAAAARAAMVGFFVEVLRPG